MLPFESDHEGFISRVLSNPDEAVAVRAGLLQHLSSCGGDEEGSYRLASLLPYVLSPDDTRLLYEPSVVRDTALLARVIWALGELHNSGVAPHLRQFLEYEDDHVVGVALTAIAKCDPYAGDELKHFKKDRRRLVRKRYVEGFQSQDRSVWEIPRVTFVRVEDAAMLGAESGEYASELAALGLDLEVHWHHEPAAVGSWAGLWATWVLPFAMGIAVNWAYDQIRAGYSRLMRLKQKGQVLRINSGYARVIAEAEIIAESSNQPYRLAKAVIKREGADDIGMDAPSAFFFEFDLEGKRIGLMIHSSGNIERLNVIKPRPTAE
ncbi:MAG: hypothetical protein ACM3X4_01270 [Ignavibacteriales bacterium]